MVETIAVLLVLCVAITIAVRFHRLLRKANESATELARANAALQTEVRERTRAEEERDQFFDLSIDLLCIASAEGTFKQLSPAWEKVFGWTLEELRSGPYVHFVHPADVEATVREAQKLRMGGATTDFENRFRTRDGSYRWLSWRVSALPDRQLLFGVARDVSEQKKLQERKNDFISVVSHEMRTPLTSIRGSLGLIAGGAAGEMPEQIRVLVEIAARNCERLGRLIDDILDIEKIESGQMVFRFAPLELTPAVEQAVESNHPYAAPYGIELRVVEALPGARTWADPDRVQQVLANLLSNATKFSPRGGTVEVGVEKRDGFLRVRVTDRGPGVPPDFEAIMFEKFAKADASSTRQKGGTGLGLSISRAIVERHGGRMGFESSPGQGATFWFELPERVPGEEAPWRDRPIRG